MAVGKKNQKQQQTNKKQNERRNKNNQKIEKPKIIEFIQITQKKRFSFFFLSGFIFHHSHTFCVSDVIYLSLIV
jgi:hypothetical protein